MGVGVVLGLALAGTWGWHAWTVRGLERNVALAEKSEADARRLLAEEREARAVVEANRDALAGTVRRQNDHIALLEASARAWEARAAGRAVATLRTGEHERRAILADGETGPEAMNRWFETAWGEER